MIDFGMVLFYLLLLGLAVTLTWFFYYEWEFILAMREIEKEAADLKMKRKELGKQWRELMDKHECPECKGTGEMVVECDDDMFIVKGEGLVWQSAVKCERCGGEGVI